MKKLFSISLLFLFTILLPTEICSQKFKGERRIYFLDATFSMETNKVGNKTLWDESKENIIDAINKIEDPTTEIVVISFADDKDSSKNQWIRIEALATDEGKEKLISQIKTWKVHDNKSLTNLGRPINNFIQKEVKSDKINYMFLLTDGDHEIGTSPQEIIKDQWDSTTPLTFGFHVQLINSKESQTSKAFKDEIYKHDRIWTVQSADVNLDLIRLENDVVLNIKNEDTIEIPIFFQGVNHSVINKIVPTLNDSDFTIKDYKIHNDKLILSFKTNKDLFSLPEESEISIKLNFPEIPKTFLLTNYINAKILNKKERALTFSGNKYKGITHQYASFLWSEGETNPYEIIVPIKFSKDAIDDQNAYAEFSFVDTEGKPIDLNSFNIIVNGQPYNGSFKLKPSDKELNLSFSFPHNVKTGDYKVRLKVIKHNLDRIGNSILTEIPNPEIIEFSISNTHSLNHLAWIFIWIGVGIVILLVLWFCFIKPVKYRSFPNFPKSVLIKQNGKTVKQFNINFKGARKIIMCNQPQKQSILNRIFTGKIKNVVQPYFSIPLIFIPSKRNSALSYGNGYLINPNPFPRSGIVKIENKSQNIEINLK